MEAFLDLVKDVWDFLKVRKKYWLAPLIITIVLMGALLVFTQGSVVAPFRYSIFSKMTRNYMQAAMDWIVTMNRSYMLVMIRIKIIFIWQMRILVVYVW